MRVKLVLALEISAGREKGRKGPQTQTVGSPPSRGWGEELHLETM